MELQLQMIGTGSAFAKTYWNNNGILSDGTNYFLIDCGITAPMALHQLGKSFNELDGVIVTHMHSDHVGGIEEYAFQMKFKYGGRKPKLIIASTLVEPLWLNTLRGGLTQDGIQRLEDVFEVIAIEPGIRYPLTSHITLQFIETPHIVGKCSYSILFNHTFFYSADMQFQPDLLKSLVADGVQTIWHDCQFIEPGEVHATLQQLLSLPDHIQKRISLMHYSDERELYEGKTGEMSFINQQQMYSIHT